VLLIPKCAAVYRQCFDANNEVVHQLHVDPRFGIEYNQYVDPELGVIPLGKIPPWRPGRAAEMARLAHFHLSCKRSNTYVWVCKKCKVSFEKLTWYEKQGTIEEFICKEHAAGRTPAKELEDPSIENSQRTACPNYCNHAHFKECLDQFVAPDPKPGWWVWYENVKF